MADITVDRLVVLIEAQTRSFESQIKRLEGQITSSSKRMADSFAPLNKSIFETGAAMMRAFKGFAGFEIVRSVGDIIKSVADIGNEAKKAGVSVDGFQKSLFAAQRTGVGQDTLVAGFAKLNLSLGEAATKGNELGNILHANGIALKSLQGDPVHALMAIADLMKNAANEQEKAIIGQAAFGKNFRELLPLLDEGSAGIAKMMDDASSLGAVIDKQLVAKAREFDDAWSGAWDGFIATGKSRAVESVDEVMRILHLIPKTSALGQILFPQALPGLDRNPFDTQRGTVVPTQANTAVTKDLEGLQKEIALIQARNSLEAQRNTLGINFQGVLARTEAEEKIIADLMAHTEGLTREQAEAQIKGNAELEKQLQLLQDATTESEKLKRTQEGIAESSTALTEGMQSITDSALTNVKSLGQSALQVLNNLETQLIDAELYGSGPFAKLFGTEGQNGNPGGLIGDAITSLVGKAAPSASTVAVTGNVVNVSGAISGIGDWFSRLFGGSGAFQGNQMGAPGMFGEQSINPNKQDFGIFGSGAVTGRALGAYPGYTDLINSAALKNRLDPDLLAALIHRESGFNPNATGPSTRYGQAQGLTQLLPGTAKDLGVTNPFDPAQNIGGGAAYLRQMMDKYGNRDEALAAYNWGPGNLDKMLQKNGGAFDLSKTPLETQKYVAAINAQAAQYAQAVQTTATTAQASATSFTSGFPSGISSLLSTLQQGASSLLSGLGSLFGGSVSGGLFGGGRASGGPVSAGQFYMVGERGPELFAPGMGGHILPQTPQWRLPALSRPDSPISAGGGRPLYMTVHDHNGNQFRQSLSSGADADHLELIVDRKIAQRVPGMIDDHVPKFFHVQRRLTGRT